MSTKLRDSGPDGDSRPRSLSEHLPHNHPWNGAGSHYKEDHKHHGGADKEAAGVSQVLGDDYDNSAEAHHRQAAKQLQKRHVWLLLSLGLILQLLQLPRNILGVSAPQLDRSNL